MNKLIPVVLLLLLICSLCYFVYSIYYLDTAIESLKDCIRLVGKGKPCY